MGKRDIARAIAVWPGSLRSLAETAGLDPSTLSRLRAGEWTASPATLEALADALLEQADLLEGVAHDCKKVGQALLQLARK